MFRAAEFSELAESAESAMRMMYCHFFRYVGLPVISWNADNSALEQVTPSHLFQYYEILPFKLKEGFNKKFGLLPNPPRTHPNLT